MLSLLSLISFGWYYYLCCFVLDNTNETNKWCLEKGQRQILSLTVIYFFSWGLLEGNSLVIKRPLSEEQFLVAIWSFPWWLLISRALASPCSGAGIQTWIMTARHLLFRWTSIYFSQGTKEQLREMGYVNIYRHTECMISSLMLHRLEKNSRKDWWRKSITPGLLLGWQTNRWCIFILMFSLTFLVSSIWCYPILIHKYLLTYIWAVKYTLCVFLEQSDPYPIFTKENSKMWNGNWALSFVFAGSFAYINVFGINDPLISMINQKTKENIEWPTLPLKFSESVNPTDMRTISVWKCMFIKITKACKLQDKKNLLIKIKVTFWKFLRTICISGNGIQFGKTLLAQFPSWFFWD